MPVSNSPAIRRRRQRGVSIVEALVAFVILSVGLLGIAGLYLESVRSNRTALTRTAAVQLANDLADRIRLHRRLLVLRTGGDVKRRNRGRGLRVCDTRPMQRRKCPSEHAYAGAPRTV